MIRYLPEIPSEGAIVYADNGVYSNDLAVFKEGKFHAGEFPVKPYIMEHVEKWFYFDEYMQKHNGKNLSFDITGGEG